jgi:hypothetical protein
MGKSHFSIYFLLLKKTKIMPDNFFESSTAAVGTIYVLFALAVIASILIWG